jgi:hypothetical protein
MVRTPARRNSGGRRCCGCRTHVPSGRAPPASRTEYGKCPVTPALGQPASDAPCPPCYLRPEEVERAAIGVERAKQPVRRNRLTQPEEPRQRAFLVHQDRRVDPFVALPSVTIRSRSCPCAPVQRCVEPSLDQVQGRLWDNSIPGSGRRWRFRRCLPRRFAGVTRPADCSASRVTV